MIVPSTKCGEKARWLVDDEVERIESRLWGSRSPPEPVDVLLNKESRLSFFNVFVLLEIAGDLQVGDNKTDSATCR